MLKPPLRLFYSYCHDDTEWLKTVRKWLDPLNMDEELVSGWADPALHPGKRWQGQIDDELASCHLFAPLITINFLNSKACREEFDMALKLRKDAEQRGEAPLPEILPILCGESTYQTSAFSQWQPLLGWRGLIADTRDAKALKDVHAGIRALARQLCGLKDVKAAADQPRVFVNQLRDLAPYLCDRDPQLKPLCQRLESFKPPKAAPALRPLIFVASGTQRQCHDGFWIRLSRNTLPQYLGGNADRVPANLLKWPGYGDGSYAVSDLQELAPQWNSSGEAHFFCVRIQPSAWRGEAALKRLFAFWNALSELKCRALIVGIFLVYREKDGREEGEMRQALKLPFDQEFKNVDTIVLPEFDSVSADDIDSWADDLYSMTLLSDFEAVRVKKLLRKHFDDSKPKIPFDDILEMIESALDLVKKAS